MGAIRSRISFREKYEELSENTQDAPGLTDEQIIEKTGVHDLPEALKVSNLRQWAQDLKPRTDIQVAAQVIGRRTEDQVMRERADTRHGPDGYRLDLRSANLQGADLSRLDLRRALLSGARMEGATLVEARMEGATLSGARMEGATLWQARMEGADLSGAQFDETTSFNAAVVQYAAVKSVDLSRVTLSQDQVTSLFGDASVTLADGTDRPEHWPEADLDWPEFYQRWRAWQAERGYTPRAMGE